MKTLYTFSVLVSFFILHSCVHTSTAQKEFALIINFKKNNPLITEKNIHVYNGEVTSFKKHFNIDFFMAKGGTTLLFGYFNIKENNPSDYKVLKISCKENTYSFSTSDISKWEHVKVNGEIVIIAPKICSN